MLRRQLALLLPTPSIYEPTPEAGPRSHRSNVLKLAASVSALVTAAAIVELTAPATTHFVAIAQLKRWAEGVAISPEETLKKRKMRELFA